MTKTRIFITVALLLVCVSVFGAWTGSDVTEIRYYDANLISTYSSVKIDYTRRDQDGPVTTSGGCPCYYPANGLSNACGAVAGSEIVAFYDKYYPELIPGWDSAYSNGSYRSQDTAYVPALMSELFNLMGTNTNGPGVTETNFLNGLKNYVNGKGRQVNYQSVVSGGILDFDQCKNAVNNNKVIVLFSQATFVYHISNGTNSDTISEITIDSAHIMVIFGYYGVTYYNNNGLIGNLKFLRVAMGKVGFDWEYYAYNASTTTAAYIVNIQ